MTSRIFAKWEPCFWERSSSRLRSCRCELLQLHSLGRDDGVAPAIQERARIQIDATIGQALDHGPMRVRHDDELDRGMPLQEIGRPLPLCGGGAIEHGAVLGIVGEMTGEQIRDPEADGGVQDAEHGDREGMTRGYSNQKSKRSPVTTRWSPGRGTASRKS